MYIIIWEYQVKAERLIEFEQIYSSNGAWAELFKKNAGYVGTELFRRANQAGRYITIDRWITPEAYDSFHENWRSEYEALDAHCGDLTESESLVGTFSLV